MTFSLTLAIDPPPSLLSPTPGYAPGSQLTVVAVRPIESRKVTVTRVIAVALHAAASVETGEAGMRTAACAVGRGALSGIGTALQVQSHSIETHGPQASHKGAPLKLCRP